MNVLLSVQLFTDGYGVADLIWYRGAQYIMKTYRVGTEYLVFGKPTVFNGRFQFTDRFDGFYRVGAEYQAGYGRGQRYDHQA